jgi:hypothetical protein
MHSVFVQDFISGHMPVMCTNRITTRRDTHSDTGSHNRLDLIHSRVPPHYVCNGYNNR